MENNNIMDYLMVSKGTLLELYKFCKVHLSNGQFECAHDVEKVSDFIDNIVRPYLDLNKAIETKFEYEVNRIVPWEDYTEIIGRFSMKEEAIKIAKKYIAENLDGYEQEGYSTTLEFDGDTFNAKTTYLEDDSEHDDMCIYITKKEVVK